MKYRQRLIIIGVFLLVLLPCMCLYFIYPKKIIPIKDNDYLISDELIWKTNELSLTNYEFFFNGWVILPGVEQGYAVLDNKSIWLYNQQDQAFYMLKSQQSNARNPEISKEIGDGVDYQSSCFSVSVNLESLCTQNETYEIYICYQCYGENYLTSIGWYIINGELIEN